MHCFYTSAFLTLCFVLSAMDGKIDQCVSIKFCMKVGKSATKTFGMLREAFGEHSLSQIAFFEWHSRPVECQLKVNIQGDQAPAE
jgi:hypothetical protein